MVADPETHTLEATRTARYATLGDPSRADEWWVVLHGYGQLAADFARNFEPIVTQKSCAIAPEGLSRFYVDTMSEHQRVGASWMTREARGDEIRDYVRALDAVIDHVAAGPRPPSVSVLGFSQGAATASRWAVLGDTRVDRLVLWGGAPAKDLELEVHADALQRMDLTLVLGNDDPHVTETEREATLNRLRDYDLPVSIHTYDGGHSIDPEVLTTVISA